MGEQPSWIFATHTGSMADKFIQWGYERLQRAGWNVVGFHPGILPKPSTQSLGFMTQPLTDIHRPDAFTQPKERREKRSGSCPEGSPAFCPHHVEERGWQTVLCFPRL